MSYIKTTVECSTGEEFPCFVDETRPNWNGFAIPVFELKEALEILKLGILGNDFQENSYYNEKTKEFVVFIDNELNVIYPEKIWVDNQPKTVYSIGENWCWRDLMK